MTRTNCLADETGLTLVDMDEESIVFVNEDGVPTGEIGPKLQSHHANTRPHIAFSCYVFRRADGAFLLSRRALHKKVWPGVWTNSVCGHPAPGEAIEDAVRRRASFELGLQSLANLRCVLPRYRYRTSEFDGVVENEFCPVFVAIVDQGPVLNPAEVDSVKWISWREYKELVDDPDGEVSYWAREQLPLLEAIESFPPRGVDADAPTGRHPTR